MCLLREEDNQIINQNREKENLSFRIGNAARKEESSGHSECTAETSQPRDSEVKEFRKCTPRAFLWFIQQAEQEIHISIHRPKKHTLIFKLLRMQLQTEHTGKERAEAAYREITVWGENCFEIGFISEFLLVQQSSLVVVGGHRHKARLKVGDTRREGVRAESRCLA